MSTEVVEVQVIMTGGAQGQSGGSGGGGGLTGDGGHGTLDQGFSGGDNVGTGIASWIILIMVLVVEEQEDLVETLM